AGLQETFDDIAAYGSGCHFNDCTHTHEKNCAVREAVKQGAIDADSYENFLKIQAESEFYQTSMVAKRRKDKAFAKVRKRFMKTSKKK
ncbi:MAG: ribosome small subunit-dependent GTPase A, partial [Planctomycetota bacterium]